MNLHLIRLKKKKLNVSHKAKEILDADFKLKLSQEIVKNTKKIIKIHPLPQAMVNLNNKVKINKLIQENQLNTNDSNSEEELKENVIKNRYRKKKINIEEILIMHNSILRKDLNPLKTTLIHMKSSLEKTSIKNKIRPVS